MGFGDGIKRTLYTDEALEEMLATLDDAQAAIREVISGKKSIVMASTQNGFSDKMFRKFLKATYELKDGNPEEKWYVYSGIDLITPIERFYSDVFGYGIETGKDAAELAEKIPEDAEATVEYIFNNLIDKRYADTLRLYYFERMTLEEVGKEYGITRERVRQIINKTIRILRHPSRSILLKKGLKRIDEVNAELEKAKNDAICGFVQEKLELDRELNAMKREIKLRREMLNGEREISEFSDVNPINIVDTDFSVRAKNVLMRSGISTVRELDGMRTSEIAKLRNMGRKTLEEIEDKRIQYGYELVFDL